MRRIVCTADKGGVGKTTTVANIAVRLAELGKKVLVADLDGQGDVTYALLGTRPPNMAPGAVVRPSMYALMVEQAAFEEVVLQAPQYSNIDVLPANKDLDRAPLLMANDPGGTTVLKRILDNLPPNTYDIVLIDTAKGRDLLLVNAIAAADEVIILVTPGTLEIDAVDRTIEHVEAVRAKTLLGAEKPRVLGILMTRADTRARDTAETLTVSAQNQIDSNHPYLLFRTTIPESVDYRRAISLSMSIFEYEARKHPPVKGQNVSRYTTRGKRIAEAYEKLVEEVLDHGRRKR